MRTILITFGGREVSLKTLFNYIIKYKDYIDEYHLYIATKNKKDIAFMENFAQEHDFVKTVYTYKDGKITYDMCYVWDNAYNNCQEEDVVYIKLDDDIVYFNEDLFTKFVPFRIKNKEVPCLYPVIINNTVISGKLEELGIINYSKKTNLLKNWKNVFSPHFENIRKNPGAVPPLQNLVGEQNLLCPIAWGDIDYCINLHNQFTNDVANNNISKYKIETWKLENCEPVSIACMSWLGSSLKRYLETYGKISRDEQWWAVYLPTWSDNRNVVFGDCVVSHYAYYVQRDKGLDNTDILEKYHKISLQ